MFLAYDGPQAFEIGNPDMLDPPVQVLKISPDKADDLPNQRELIKVVNSISYCNLSFVLHEIKCAALMK